MTAKARAYLEFADKCVDVANKAADAGNKWADVTNKNLDNADKFVGVLDHAVPVVGKAGDMILNLADKTTDTACNIVDKITDILTMFIPGTYERKIEYLNETSATTRAMMLLDDINLEVSITELEQDIEDRVTYELDKTQKEYILNEEK